MDYKLIGVNELAEVLGVPFRWVGFIAFPKESGYHSFLRCFKTVDVLEVCQVLHQYPKPQYLV